MESTAPTGRALLVEDSPVARRLLRHTLENLGLTVTETADGLDGFRMGMTSRYDLVVADLSIPGMDGLELISRLRKHDHYMDTPMVITTATWSQAHHREHGDLKIAAWLLKPIDPQLFGRAIEKLLGLNAQGRVART